MKEIERFTYWPSHSKIGKVAVGPKLFSSSENLSIGIEWKVTTKIVISPVPIRNLWINWVLEFGMAFQPFLKNAIHHHMV